MDGTGEERWLVDEMLGRLVRYLRILGCDAEYVRELPDAMIRERARSEGRTLVTRDAALARATPGAVFVQATDVRGQLRELWSSRPGLGRAPRFDRCTRCNGSLLPFRREVDPSEGIPPPLLSAVPPVALYRCARCGQPYWEGSHTRRIRGFLEEAATAVPP